MCGFRTKSRCFGFKVYLYASELNKKHIDESCIDKTNYVPIERNDEDKKYQ